MTTKLFDMIVVTTVAILAGIVLFARGVGAEVFVPIQVAIMLYGLEWMEYTRKYVEETRSYNRLLEQVGYLRMQATDIEAQQAKLRVDVGAEDEGDEVPDCSVMDEVHHYG